MVSPVGDEESGAVRVPSSRSLASSRNSARSSPPPEAYGFPPTHRRSPSPGPETTSKNDVNETIEARPGSDELDPEKPDEWVWRKYGRHLLTQVTPWVFNRANKGEQSFEVSLAEVQRMYLVQLRIRLARHIVEWEKSGGSKISIGGDENGERRDCWEDDLHRYVQGLQDYDYMDKCSQTLNIDPFRMSGESQLDRIILDKAFGKLRENEAFQARLRNMRVQDVRRWDSHLRAIIPSRSDNQYKRLFGRLVVSAVGAGFLIGPMWLMMLQTGLYVALVSTSAFVLVFGVLMACVLDEHIKVLSSTAAYAAVLVVFVGLRGESPALG